MTQQSLEVLEKQVQTHIKLQVSTFLEPVHFAYSREVGVKDAIVYLLQRAHSQLDKACSTVGNMFLDFCSAFNTIQPTLLRGKLKAKRVDPSTTSWIIHTGFKH